LKPSLLYDSALPRRPLVEEFTGLFRYRELIRQLIARSIKTRYKRSILGVAWTLINPLLTMLVLALVFSRLFRISVPNYPLYVLSGLVIWNFFASSTSLSMGEMLWSSGLLGKIYLPKSVFSVSVVGAGLVNLLISFIPLFIIAAVFKVKPTLALISIPPALLILAVFTLGVGLLLSTAAVFFGDSLPIYEVLLIIWMYATPIIYPIEIIPQRLMWIFKLNPLYSLLVLFRDPIYYGTFPPGAAWLVSTIYALVAIAIGALLFTSRSDEFAYRI